MPDVAEHLRAGGTAFSSRAVIHTFNICPYSPECVEGVFSEVGAEKTCFQPPQTSQQPTAQTSEKPGHALGRGISEGARLNDDQIVVPTCEA